MNVRIIIAFVTSLTSAFALTNVYWLLTVTYAKPVTDFGEKGVLTGFEAAEFLISKYGLDAYLNGLFGLYVVAAISCFVLCLIGVRGDAKAIVLKAALLSVFSALVFRFFYLKVYVRDGLTGKSGFYSGLDAIQEVGLVWLLGNFFFLSVLFFATLILNTLSCRLISPSSA